MLSVLNCREIHGAWYLQEGESVDLPLQCVAVLAVVEKLKVPQGTLTCVARGAVTDLRIECETPKHRLYQGLGALGILLYPVRGARGRCDVLLTD